MQGKWFKRSQKLIHFQGYTSSFWENKIILFSWLLAQINIDEGELEQKSWGNFAWWVFILMKIEKTRVRVLNDNK